MNTKKILCVISARGGSKGVPRKNLKLLGDKPLIHHAIQAARQSRFINRVICSTEDEEIKKIAMDCGAEVPFKRPPELATDDIPLIRVTQHAMIMMDELGFRSDIVVQLAPTAPFIKPGKLDEGIRKILETTCDSIVSVNRIGHEHPYRALEVKNGDIISPYLKTKGLQCLQRQDFPELYYRTGGFFIRKRHLLEQWTGEDFCLGDDSRAVFLDDIQAVDINTLTDFSYAEFIIERMTGRNDCPEDREL